MSNYTLGRIAGLQISATPSALLSLTGLLVVSLGVTLSVLNWPVSAAIGGSLLVVGLHLVANLGHHFGHAWAAARTGYPMSGVLLGKWGLLGTSLYPTSEPALPARIHIRRALGGPLASLGLSLIAGALVLVLPRETMLWWATLFFLADNLGVFFLGSLLPLGFTDGSTLLHWWGKQ